MDLISQNMGTNPRKQTSWTSANGLQTTGTMNPLGLTQNDQAAGYLGASAPAQPSPQPTPPQPSPAPQPTPATPPAAPGPLGALVAGGSRTSPTVATPTPMGGMSYARPAGDLISENMQNMRGVADPAADPYATGITGMPATVDSAGQAGQMMGQLPQQSTHLRPMSPQFGPDGAPSWGGPRFMSNARRRLPYAPPSSPVSQ